MACQSLLYQFESLIVVYSLKFCQGYGKTNMPVRNCASKVVFETNKKSWKIPFWRGNFHRHFVPCFLKHSFQQSVSLRFYQQDTDRIVEFEIVLSKAFLKQPSMGKESRTSKICLQFSSNQNDWKLMMLLWQKKISLMHFTSIDHSSVTTKHIIKLICDLYWCLCLIYDQTHSLRMMKPYLATP